MTYIYLPQHSSEVPAEQDARRRNLMREGVTTPEGDVRTFSPLLWEIGCRHIPCYDHHGARRVARRTGEVAYQPRQ